jgi:4-amino-4-deoxy-L-arabinose transferase-like glycosyltransferase
MHLLIAPQFELGADEAHYALYGLNLDWSYFDHPPMIGWLQAIVLQFSDSELALRLVPVLLFALTSLALYRLIEEVFPQKEPWLPFVSVAIVYSALIFQLLGLSMVPDCPLMLFAVLTVSTLHRIFDKGDLGDWCLLGLWLGLAGLSKYTAVTLVFSAVLLVVIRRRFDLLRGLGIWLAFFIAASLISPVIYWNAINDWISFSYQFRHGTEATHWSGQRLLISQAAQMLTYSPGIYLLGILAVFSLLRRGSNLGVQYLAAFGLPVLILFAWNSGYEETLPHWPAFGWMMLAPITALWLSKSWGKRWVRLSAWSSLAYSLVIITLVHSQLAKPWLPCPDNFNLVQDLHGWEQASVRAKELSESISEETGKQTGIYVTSWPFASRLAWYSRPLPVGVVDQRFDQFDIWFGPISRGAQGIVLIPVYAKEQSPETGTPGHFSSCRIKDNLSIMMQGRIITSYKFFHCQDYLPPDNQA